MIFSRVCFIADRRHCDLPIETAVLLVLRAGVTWIQYREKEYDRRDIYETALRLRELTARFHAALIVNDHADIALAIDAEGVHLGQDDLPLPEARRIMGKKVVGISTHTIEEAGDASDGGADYIGFGPVFPTTTKDAGPPKGIDILRGIKQNVMVPVVAIGGITAENAPLALQAGADAVAVISALATGDVSQKTARFLKSTGRAY